MPKYIPADAQARLLEHYETQRVAHGVGWGRCFCGCGRRTRLAPYNDLTKNQLRFLPRRLVRGHRVILHSAQYVEDKQTGCWVWQKAVRGSGYGVKKIYGKQVPAHRFYYEARYGPIPDELQPDHLCKNILCVNPEHIEIVTPAENCRRRSSTRLTPGKVLEARYRYRAGLESIRSMATRFTVSRATLEKAIHGATWRDV